MTLTQNAKSKNDSRIEHMTEDGAMANRLTPKDLQKWYKEANYSTAGTVFGRGDRHIGLAVRDEVIFQNEARWNKEAATSDNKKKELRKLAAVVGEIWHKQAKDDALEQDRSEERR